jgi:2-polyprenyl-6-methoxyphenol hydroxylase-like FAD-dependent oxidoreductase
MTDALALAEHAGPVLAAGGDDAALDAALAAYNDERRAASERSVMVNDERALAPYRDEVFKRPADFLAMWSRTDRRPAAAPAGN